MNRSGAPEPAFTPGAETAHGSERLFFENPLPMWLYDRRTLAFIEVNGAACCHYGYSRAEFLTMTIADIRPPEDVPRLMDAVARSAPAWRQSGVWRHRTKGGAIIFAEVSSHNTTFRGRAAILVVAYDVTKRVRAEAAARDSEAHLKEAQRLAQVGSWQWDATTDAVTWSDELFRITGRDPALGAPALGEQHSLYRGDGWERIKAASRRLLATGESVEVETEILRPDGEARWIVSRGAAIRDASGAVIAVHGTSEDVTERHRARRQLEESEERFRCMTEAIQDVFWIRPATGERMVYVSPAYEQIWGRSLESIYSDPRSFFDAVHPEDRERVIAELRAHWDTPFECEYRIVRADGSVRWIRDRGYPIRDASGAVAMMTGAASDVTELQEKEDLLKATNLRLEHSERRYRDLLENLNDIVWSVDEQGCLRYVSPRVAKYGYTVEGLIGQHVSKVVHPEDWPQVDAALQSAAHDQTTSVEFRAIDGEGREHYMRTSARSLTEAGRCVGITGLLVDITDQRRTEEQLRASQRLEAVGRLAGGIAHDFNNLLVAINGYAELAMDHVSAADPLRDDLQEILKAGNRAAALTRQLLAFSRKQLLKPEIVNLNDVVKGMESMLRRLIREDIQVETALTAGIGTVRVDPTQIEQVILNLVINARDAMPDGGTLRIATHRAACPSAGAPRSESGDDYVVLVVSDTGCGMDEHTRTNMFEPFFSTKPKGQGTGLGLATVYGIVKQSGGTISVDTAIGHGTMISIAFPVDRSRAETPAEPPARSERGGAETVLLVEDEHAVRHLTERFLTTVGYRVLTATTGHEAIRIAEEKSESIDLLLTDVIMPQMSGYELAARLTALKPGLKVIYMTGYSGPEVAPAGRRIAGVCTIQKPFSAAQLREHVRTALART